MLRIGCLINSPHVLPQLRAQIEYYIHNAVQNGKRIDAYKIYGTMRKDFIEIDFESFAVLYDNIANHLDPTRSVMTDIDTLTKIAKKSFDDTVQAVASGQGKHVVREIGKDSPERVIGNTIARMLTMPTFTQTLLHKLQTAVMAKANEALGIQPQVLQKGSALQQISDAVTKALELKEANDTYGVLRKSATLIDEVSNELDRMINELVANGDHAKAAELGDLKTAFIKSVSDFLLTKGKTAELVKNLLKTAGFFNTSGELTWDRIVDKATQAELYTSAEFVAHVKDVLMQQGLSDIEATFIATAAEAQYKIALQEKIAQDTNVPRSTIEKLQYYQSLIDEQPDSEILRQNYAITLTKALDLDPTHAAMLGAVTMELGKLFHDLNNVNYADTIVMRNAIDRKIALVLHNAGITYKMVGHIMESIQAHRNILLLNPYNITQNIVGGILSAITSGKIFGSAWRGAWDAAANVAIGGVDTVRGVTDQINVQTAVRDRATSIWRTDGTLMSALKTPHRILLGLQDVFLGFFDALFTTKSKNDLVNKAVEKYIRATSANPEQDIADYYSAFNDPARKALIESEADKIIAALNLPTSYYRKRLINEMLQGAIVTEATSVNTHRVILDASNMFSKMQHGKTPNSSVLAHITRAMASARQYLQKSAETLEDKGDESAMLLHAMARILSFSQQWMIGGMNWGVIAYDFSGMRFIEAALPRGKWRPMTSEAFMEALKQKNKQAAIHDIATMADKQVRLRRAVFGVTMQVLAVIIDMALRGDDPPEDYLANEDGTKKLAYRIAQGFPIFYTYYAYTRAKEDEPSRRRRTKPKEKGIPKKVIEATAAALSPMYSRYPTESETIRGVLTGRASAYDALANITDIYSIQGYEMTRQWYNAFVAKDNELKRNTHPKSLMEATFHTGLMRALLDKQISSSPEQEFVGLKKELTTRR